MRQLYHGLFDLRLKADKQPIQYILQFAQKQNQKNNGKQKITMQ